MAEEQIEFEEIPEILEAVRDGDAAKLELLLTGGDLEQVELDAALHEASWRGNAEMVKTLLGSGADKYSLNSHEEPLMLSAVCSRSKEVVQLLLALGYYVNHGTGNTLDTTICVPLHVAIAAGDDEIVELLLDAGVAVDVRDVDDDPPIVAASQRGSLRVVEGLLKRGCTVDEPGYMGNTALMRACELNMTRIVEKLVKAGADVNIKNEDGQTAMDVAKQSGSVGCLRVLTGEDCSEPDR